MRFRLLWINLATVAFIILSVNAELKAQSPGTLTNMIVSSNDSRAGEGAIYTFNFTTSAFGNGVNTGLPSDGKIRLQFPEGFDLSTVSIAHSTNGSINGGFSSINITTVGVDTFIDLTRDNTGSNVGTSQPLSLSIAMIINTKEVRSNYSMNIMTMTSTNIYIDQGSGTFPITAGPLMFLSIDDAPNGSGNAITTFSLPVDQTKTLYAVGYDAYGNYVGNISVTWNVTNQIGTVSPNDGTKAWTTFTATTAGSGIVSANDGSGHVDNTDLITVNAGALSSIKILEGSSGNSAELVDQMMTTDQTLTVHAAGYDVNNNYIGDVEVDWSLSDSIGLISPASNSIVSYFYANTVGTGRIHASHPTAGADETGDILVTVGKLNYITIAEGDSGDTNELNDTIIHAGDTLRLHAAGFDADGNYVDDVDVDWYVVDAIGTVNPSSNAMVTTFFAQKSGTGYIRAVHATVGNDRTGDIEVKPGDLHHLIIESGSDKIRSEVQDTVVHVNKDLELYAAGYDEFNNYIRDVVATWRQTGTLDFPDSLTGRKISFAPITPGSSGRIYCDSLNVFPDTTGLLTVGNATQIVITTIPGQISTELHDITIAADETLRLYASGFDINGYYVGLVEVDWLISGLAPDTSSSSTSLLFNPTTANLSGKIFARHATVPDDSTGIISVIPGAPSGRFRLLPESLEMSSNSADTIAFTSTVVRDNDQNVVSDENLMTISYSPATLGLTILPVDDSPEYTGHQIRLDSNSRLNFHIISGNRGGTASIVANSIRGSAHADTLMKITGLRVLSVNSTNDSLSQGQQDIQVQMLIKNTGTTDLHSLISRLKFYSATKENLRNDYTVDDVTIDSLDIGEERLITFPVSIRNDAQTGTVFVDGYVEGMTTGGVALQDTSATSVHSWLVLKPARLRVIDISAPDVVEQGTVTTVYMRIENTGEATATVHADTLFFYTETPYVDVTQEYDQVPKQRHPFYIRPGQIKTLEFTVSIGANSSKGNIVIDGSVYGSDKNSGQLLNDMHADTTDVWEVKKKGEIEVLTFEPSQGFVNLGQQSIWYVSMTIENKFETMDLFLDSTRLEFFAGTDDITSQFNVVAPAQFVEFSGTDTLFSNQIQTVLFQIRRSSVQTLGNIRLKGHIYLSDIAHTTLIAVAENQVIVKEPSQLTIQELMLSQDEVTVGQGKDWYVKCVLENSGSSPIRLLLDSTMTTLTFSAAEGYKVRHDTALVLSGNDILEAQHLDTLVFTIDETGHISGFNRLELVIPYIDTIATNDTLQATDSDHQILVETLPHLRIKETKNMAVNAPSVNTNQHFDLLVVLENLGDDAALNAVLYVETDSHSSIAPLAPVMIRGHDVDSLYVHVTADSNWSFGEWFTSSITEVHGENTSEFDDSIEIEAIDDTAKTVIQRPANVSLKSLLLPGNPVKALSADWELKAVVERLNAGTVEFDLPDENSIRFYHNDAEQTDYFVTRPTMFVNSGNLILSGWDVIHDTLIFTIDKTGLMGGEIVVDVTLTGRYLNNDSTFIIEKTALLNVESTANLRILRTDPVCPNTQDEIGVLSTGQNYEVQVTIQNTGDEDVEDVHIALRSGSNTYRRTVDRTSKLSQLAVNFPLMAPESEQKLQFTSSLESAISSLSGIPATITAAVDSTVTFQVEKKAALVVKLYDDDAVLTMGRIAHVRYVVENLGTADTDSSGKVMVSLPAGYRIEVENTIDSNNVVLNFMTDQTDTLNIWPPANVSSGDLLQVTINTPPKDVNMGLPAYVESHLDTLYLKTVNSNMNVMSRITWPTGAVDNIVSTDQLFDLQATISKSDNIKSVVSAIELPYGYQLDFNEDSVKNVNSGRVTWRIRSPEVEHLENRSLLIKTVGFIGENEYIIADTLEVKCEKKAQLYISDVGIISPAQTDSTLVINQSFTVSATVINEGLADVAGKGSLRISFGSTGVTTLQDTIKQFTVGNPVLWDLRAPAYVMGTGKITFTIVDVPDDENTNQGAGGLGDRRTISVKTVNKGFISIDSLKIIDPAGAIDGTLSTSQTFTVRAYAHWENCDNLPIVTLRIPDNFITEIESKNPSGTSNQGTVTWSVIAPADPVIDNTIWAEATAYDVHSGENINTVSGNIELSVVRRAEISLIAEIVSPADAIDGIVTTNQPFVVQTYLWKSGDATIEDYYSVRLTLPAGGGYKTTDVKDKRVLHDEKVSWTITAPATSRDADIIRIDLIETPHDENTKRAILSDAVIEDSRAIPIATEEKRVEITLLAQKEQNSFAKGDTNVSMFSFQMHVSGDENSSRVLFKGLKLAVKDRANTTLSQANKAISRLTIIAVHLNDSVLGTVDNIQDSGFLSMSFNSPDTLIPTESQTYELLVDISPQASITDFQLSIDSLGYFDLADIGSGEIPVLSNINNQSLSSGFAVIVPKDFNEAFWNYPNPFGSTGKEMTTFQYYLDQDSDVQISVYTILGELVWSASFSKNDPQGLEGLHDGANAILWNGRNDGGDRVLNGVYIAYIRTDYGKSAVTKIAILK
ncbi:hypothetical protein JXB12_07935 [candidate division KSB1 bacterium]|nr:hypothetical protein [candidate division KSB1 bacterium]